MNLSLRPGCPEDAPSLGTICYQAFKSIAEKHHFPPDFPHSEAAIGLMSFMLSQKNVYSVVAQIDEHIAGSNFLWEGDPIAGVGPITVDPHLQNGSVGRKLMENILQRGEEGACVGVRLVQAAYHNRSLSLYTKLGFDVQEPLSQMQGPAMGITFVDYPVRLAQEADIEACNQVCIHINGHHRGGELLRAIKAGTAIVVEHKGEITGYTTGVGFFGHAVGKTNQELQALIGASTNFSGPGFLLPTRNGALMRWCLSHGLRVVQPMTLMSKGFYKQPDGVFLCSILF